MQSLLTGGHISFALVFIEGLLSFFSPCVIPLIPIYVSYLAGSADRDETGAPVYHRGRVMLHTVFFILGVSFAFFLLGLSFTAIGTFFSGHKTLFARIGGVVIVLLGLVQIGFFELPFLQRERRFHLNMAGRRMNPAVAFVMGFTFSFAWTPCVGPALSSVLILASGAKSAATGNLLVLLYAAGFVLPFLALGLFTTQALNFLRSHKKLMRYTIKAGGVLLILIGVMTFTGWMNGVTGYLSSFGAPPASNEEAASAASSQAMPEQSGPSAEEPGAQAPSSSASEQPAAIPAFDFTLTDQYGNTHTLSDYKGKVVFLNFWATWCPPCRQEMPHIEELYNEYGQNTGDVVFLGVTNPKTDENPYGQDGSPEEIAQFLTDNGYTFPSAYDTTGSVFSDYFISAFPTTFLIDAQGNIFGYAPGAMTKQMMENIIKQVLDAAAEDGASSSAA
ncbi:cytochrome c biogenesis protein CcdA [Anaerotruncus colihominis]|uniref:redoxin domain-containing protein n=1 Tax=Anaerotruncus colihominis TaxID=169435 RepID=UPI003515C285